ncbi:hypothetical protein JQ594_05200 [Bradyrhizobium manausense]|uniref:hypothetical protein n=1 Tax=Bradyrhizobium manausense TaxID=989370 RepID=UPI001BAB028C|nr:hypothetical protein [Bradyrhizobium manausense]MBR0685301.1 hypothetical protein [Bradyrhizobium manausense]
MTKNTFPVNGGAVPALTIRNMIDEETGELRLWVLKGLARREAMRTWGDLSPRSLRFAIRVIADTIPEMQCAWRQRHGLPVAMSTITPFGTAPRWRASVGVLKAAMATTLQMLTVSALIGECQSLLASGALNPSQNASLRCLIAQALAAFQTETIRPPLPERPQAG